MYIRSIMLQENLSLNITVRLHPIYFNIIIIIIIIIIIMYSFLSWRTVATSEAVMTQVRSCQCVCVVDANTLLLLRMVCSCSPSLLFHFFAEICACFCSMENSAIDCKL